MSIEGSKRSISSYSAKIDKASARSKVGISFGAEDDSVTITKIEENSLAAKTDLQEGDKVTAINGVSTENLSARDSIKLVRKAKSEVTIDVEKVIDVEEDLEMATEETGLLGGKDVAASMSGPLGTIIVGVQVVVAVLLFLFFDYASAEEFDQNEYMIFRDIMVMLLLGFGYLMTFLGKYGLGAVGLTMMLTVLNMECNLIIEGFFTGNTDIGMSDLINAEFSAAALLISFGALIGRATPLQMCGIAVAESLFYAANKVFIVFGLLQAEDVGGTITIHMFGAYFGLAAAKAMGPQEKESASNNAATTVSDVLALIGTTLLWVYWPSFVGATETGDTSNEMHCLINTIMALLGSTSASFYLSQQLNGGKFDPVHIQNSTLAGGVAIGTTARMAIHPSVAFVVGLGAGIVSVLGYFYSSPYLESAFGIWDTCGVGNLHGYPSVLGGLASILLVFLDHNAEFLNYGLGTQSLFQLFAVVATLAIAIVTGYASGTVLFYVDPEVDDYTDEMWWIGEFDG
jgi:ammonium transporter Rh